MSDLEIKSASSTQVKPFQRILLVGPTGAGKSAQIWTLPGEKFLFAFDMNTLPTVAGCPRLDYAEFYPDFNELDSTLKGFNKGSRSDKPKQAKEPTLYLQWIDFLNEFVDSGRYKKYDWLIFDSLTFLAKAVMDRQLFINNRYGDIEDLGDYRVVGSKISDVFNSITALETNIYCTGHLQAFQDDKTKRVVTQIFLPGKARSMLPLSHTQVWQAQTSERDGRVVYEIRTVPDVRGLQDIRSSIRGLKPIEDVTIEDFAKAENYGIGRLLKRSN
jgi:hypothetical protein